GSIIRLAPPTTHTNAPQYKLSRARGEPRPQQQSGMRSNLSRPSKLFRQIGTVVAPDLQEHVFSGIAWHGSAHGLAPPSREITGSVSKSRPQPTRRFEPLLIPTGGQNARRYGCDRGRQAPPLAARRRTLWFRPRRPPWRRESRHY